MGWFTGNYGRVNAATMTRFDEAMGLMRQNKALVERAQGRSLDIIKSFTTVELSDANKAREAAIAAAKGRNARALEQGLAASSDPIKQGEAAAAAGADRSVVRTLIDRGKIEQGILSAEAQQNLSITQQMGAAKMAAQAAEAGLLGQLQEEGDPGMGKDLLKLAGIAIGAKMKDWMKPDAPYSTDQPQEVAGDVEIVEPDVSYPEVVETEPLTMGEFEASRTIMRPDAPQLSPVSPFDKMGLESLRAKLTQGPVNAARAGVNYVEPSWMRPDAVVEGKSEDFDRMGRRGAAPQVSPVDRTASSMFRSLGPIRRAWPLREQADNESILRSLRRSPKMAAPFFSGTPSWRLY